MASPGAALRIKIPELEGDPELGEVCNGMCANPPPGRERRPWFRSWLPIKKEDPAMDALRSEFFTTGLIGMCIGICALFIALLGGPGIRWDGIAFGFSAFILGVVMYLISTS